MTLLIDISHARKYQDHIPSSFAYKVVCVDNKYNKKILLYRRRNTVINLLNQFLMSTIIVEKL